MDLKHAGIWGGLAVMGGIGAVFAAYASQGALPFAEISLRPADCAAMLGATVLPVGVAGSIARALTRPGLAPWALRRDNERIDTWLTALVVIGALAACYLVIASVAFSAATRTAGWWQLGDIVAVASWTDKNAWAARFALALPLVAMLAMWLPAVIKPRRLHGSARWGTWRDAKRSMLDSPRGIVLGLLGGRPLVYGGKGHVLGVGPSRSGKGVGWIVPTLLNWPGSVVVMDMKRENHAHASGWRKSQGQPQYVFDPFDADTHTLNPLQYVREATDNPADEIDRVARILYQDNGKDAHWIDGARGAFRGAVAHLWATDRDNLSLARVVEWVPQNLISEQRLAELIAEETTNPMALAEFRKLLATPGVERGSFLSTLSTVLSPWLLPSIAYATNTSDFDFRTLRTKPQSIYFCVTPDNAGRSLPLQRIFWQQIIDALTRRLPTKAEKWPVLLIMDEFTMPGPLPLIMESAAFLAGYNVKLFIIVQSTHQLEATYDPPRTRALIDTMAVRAYYAPNDLKSAEALSNELGTANFKSVSRSRQSGKMATNVSASDQRRALMLPQEVLQMGESRTVITQENGRPLLGTKEKYYVSRRYRKKAKMKPAAFKTAAPVAAKAAIAPFNSRGIIRESLIRLTNTITSGDARDDARLYLEDIYG